MWFKNKKRRCNSSCKYWKFQYSKSKKEIIIQSASVCFDAICCSTTKYKKVYLSGYFCPSKRQPFGQLFIHSWGIGQLHTAPICLDHFHRVHWVERRCGPAEECSRWAEQYTHPQGKAQIVSKMTAKNCWNLSSENGLFDYLKTLLTSILQTRKIWLFVCAWPMRHDSNLIFICPALVSDISGNDFPLPRSSSHIVHLMLTAKDVHNV